MSDQETAVDPRRLRIMAPFGMWIPDNTGVEVHYDTGTVLPENAWPSSRRTLNAMIKAGDLAVEPDAVPEKGDADALPPG